MNWKTFGLLINREYKNNKDGRIRKTKYHK